MVLVVLKKVPHANSTGEKEISCSDSKVMLKIASAIRDP